MHAALDKEPQLVRQRWESNNEWKKQKTNKFMYYVKYFNWANNLSDPAPQGISIIIGFH